MNKKAEKLGILLLTLSLVLGVGRILIANTQVSAAIINVPNNYSTIQGAIDAANNGDIIIAEPDIYYENIDFKGKAVTVQSTDPDDPAIVATTIIDGQSAGSVVQFKTGEESTSVLCGFTLRNGSSNYGGGIWCHISSPIITKCTISANSASYSGGGIYCSNGYLGISTPAIINCTISNNLSEGSGGGIYCAAGSSPTITNCTINGNSSLYYGGGVCCYDGTQAIIDGCNIFENLAYTGGGLYSMSTPTVTNCNITNNTASYSGGGICCSISITTITKCTISGNSAESNGGGIYLYCDGQSNITNCIISENVSANTLGGGGGIYSLYSSPAITNCTITENSTNGDGGGFFCDDCLLTITNCIIWHDLPNEISHGDYCEPPTVTYSDIQGGFSGTGNINDNPLFVNPNNEDYHLQPSSPCIDTGTNDGAPVEDMEGVSRPIDGNGDSIALCDMGVYEYHLPITDADGDGHDSELFGGDDCDDNDGSIYPGAPELCDGKDNDCDGLVPENEADADSDGFMICEGDCDDGNSMTYPGALEVCDGQDNNCDGLIDEGFDEDADGYTICGDDCDDSDPSVYPGAEELCDGKDNDCDGVVDEGCALASAETPVAGTVNGTFADTHISDNVYESILERESGGKPDNRYSFLEHVWSFEVTAGDTVIFYVEAYHSENLEDDDFVFSYSIDGLSFTDMVTITKTSDDNSYQSFMLPNDTSGIVYIRVRDGDSTQGHRVLDEIFIDHMYIHSNNGFDTEPPTAPTGLTALGGNEYVSLNWNDNMEPDLAGYNVHRSTTAGGPYLQIASALTISEYIDQTVTNGITYYYVVTAIDVSSNESAYSNEASATPQDSGSELIMFVNDIAMSVRGSGNKYYGQATIWIKADDGTDVSGATVVGEWSGAVQDVATGITGPDGQLLFESPGVKYGGTFIFTVTDVSKTGYVYYPGLNNETSDSITAP